MDVLLGFDPGGKDGFGWCAIEDALEVPFTIVGAGVADHAEGAVRQLLASLPSGAVALAAGVDAPLFWSPRGDRKVDRIVRGLVASRGAPSPGGTVQAVNSLRGACITQGVMIASLLRVQWPSLPITEAHPKAYLWTRGIAAPGTPTGAVSLQSMGEFAATATSSAVEHVRDAAIAAYCAWAMVHRVDGWRDLLLDELDAFLPVPKPLAYWYPAAECDGDEASHSPARRSVII